MSNHVRYLRFVILLTAGLAFSCSMDLGQSKKSDGGGTSKVQEDERPVDTKGKQGKSGIENDGMQGDGEISKTAGNNPGSTQTGANGFYQQPAPAPTMYSTPQPIPTSTVYTTQTPTGIYTPTPAGSVIVTSTQTTGVADSGNACAAFCRDVPVGSQGWIANCSQCPGAGTNGVVAPGTCAGFCANIPVYAQGWVAQCMACPGASAIGR
ncbi:MAG: hypothetical protein HQK54_17080 [Oligoflexales bacterium]|nr:hypothetical protein [Oligoflexales bacterium]